MTSETVGTLFSHISRRNSDMKNNNVITNSAEFGLIPQRDFFDKDIAVEGNTDKYYIIGRGDFVYNPRKSTTAPYGPFNCYQGEEEGIVSPLYTCLKPLYPEMADYLLWYFRSPAWYSYIYHNGAQGGARHDRVGMTNDLMDGIPVNLPCKTEQKKISEFFTLLDKRITAQQHLVEALKSYKRGALSKLFPKEGASVPEYRFAGFTGDWEQRKVSEVMETRRGLTFKPSDIRENGIRVLRSSNIDEDRFVLKNDDVFVDKNAVNVEYVKENDILITAANGSSRLVGKHAIICDIPVGSAVHGGFMLLGVAKEPYFINASMSSTWYKKFIDLFVAGGNGTIGNLNKNDLDNQYIPIPSKSERKKVGNFFRLLDNLIAFHRQEVSIAQKIKSGLLQGLFI